MSRYALILRLALTGIFANKTRAFLTMLGIIIGVASVIAIQAVGAGAQSLITAQVRNIGTNLIGVLPGASKENGPPAAVMGITITTLTYDDAKAIEKLPHIAGISAYARGNADLSAGKESLAGNFSGVTAAYPVVENHDIARGRFFTGSEEESGKRVAVLGAELAEKLFPYGDPLGERVKIGNARFAVIGILGKKGSSLGTNPDMQAFVPLKTAQRELLGTRHLGLIRVKIDREEYIPAATASLKQLLRSRHRITNPEDDDFTVTSLDQALSMLTAITGGLKYFLSSIAAISLIVGGIGITNVMLMTVKERTREIGLKKAIGARPLQIRNQFLLEAVLLTTMGGSLGILLGAGLAYAIAVGAAYAGYSWDFVISPVAVLIAFGISTAVGILFGMYPARKAARLHPILALRYE